MNPNSSSLGVDVTFLLFGAAALSFATPVVSALLRLRKTTAVVDRRSADTKWQSAPGEAAQTDA